MDTKFFLYGIILVLGVFCLTWGSIQEHKVLDVAMERAKRTNTRSNSLKWRRETSSLFWKG